MEDKYKWRSKMKVDLRKSTKSSLQELEDYCMGSYVRLENFRSGQTQYEKGKAHAMYEIGTKLKKIMYKER